MSVVLINELVKEIKEMNLACIYHCNRCHASLKSDNFRIPKGRKVIEYLAPVRCAYCKDPEWFKGTETKQALATEANGLLVQCQHEDCGKQAYIKASFYIKQQSIQHEEFKSLMPVLIDSDKEKVSRLLGENDHHEEEELAHK